MHELSMSSALMRTATPCVTVTRVRLAIPLVSAVMSQTVLAHSESPLPTPATPNCCAWPAEQPRSSALERMSSLALIGFTEMHEGAGLSWVVYSGVPSPLRSVHKVVAVPHGVRKGFA